MGPSHGQALRTCYNVLARSHILKPELWCEDDTELNLRLPGGYVV
jgi:hypothetical protein